MTCCKLATTGTALALFFFLLARISSSVTSRLNLSSNARRISPSVMVPSKRLSSITKTMPLVLVLSDWIASRAVAWGESVTNSNPGVTGKCHSFCSRRHKMLADGLNSADRDRIAKGIFFAFCPALDKHVSRPLKLSTIPEKKLRSQPL